MKDIFEGASSNNHRFLQGNTIIVAIFSLLLGLCISAFVIKNQLSVVSSLLSISIISILLGFLIRDLAWKINEFLKKRITWPEHSLKAMFINFIPAFLLSSIISYITQIIVWNIIKNQEIDHLAIIIWSFSFSLIFNLGLYAVLFLEKWKETIVREESLKREQLNFQYDNLVSRANPNMLFTSLKILKEKVNINQEEAVHFVKQISDFYRYSLDQRNKDIVELSEELNYVRNLTFLLQAQFPQVDLIIKIDIKNNVYILPFSIGAIIEYVILNSLNNSKIEIYLENEKNDFLILKIKGTLKDSFPLDIAETILDKYNSLTEKKLQIEIKENFYEIKFPLIDVK